MAIGRKKLFYIDSIAFIGLFSKYEVLWSKKFDSEVSEVRENNVTLSIEVDFLKYLCNVIYFQVERNESEKIKEILKYNINDHAARCTTQ